MLVVDCNLINTGLDYGSKEKKCIVKSDDITQSSLSVGLKLLNVNLLGSYIHLYILIILYIIFLLMLLLFNALSVTVT